MMSEGQEIIREIDLHDKKLITREKMAGFKDPLYLISPSFYYAKQRGENIKKPWKRYISWLHGHLCMRIDHGDALRLHAHREAIANEYMKNSSDSYQNDYKNYLERAKLMQFGNLYNEPVFGTSIMRSYVVIYEFGEPKLTFGDEGCRQQ